jgi:hypothetical protein
MLIALISWIFYLLQPSEPVQACTRIAEMEDLTVVLVRILVVWSVDVLCN